MSSAYFLAIKGEKNMTVKKGDKVKMDYTGTLKDGTVFDSSTHGDHSHPIEFVVGDGKIIKGFDSAVVGMKKGEEKEITLKPEEAYGEHRAEMIQEVPRDQLPKEQEPTVGMMLMMNLPNGAQLHAKITEVTDRVVKIDVNHPLAGKTLNFKIKLVDIVQE